MKFGVQESIALFVLIVVLFGRRLNKRRPQ